MYARDAKQQFGRKFNMFRHATCTTDMVEKKEVKKKKKN